MSRDIFVTALGTAGVATLVLLLAHALTALTGSPYVNGGPCS